MSDNVVRTREQRLSKERMEDVSTGDGFVYDASGRKLRKPRLSSEDIPDHRAAASPETPTTNPNGANFSLLVAAVVTMLAFKSEWPEKCGISGDGRPVPAEYAAPMFGFAAALLVQQYYRLSVVLE